MKKKAAIQLSVNFLVVIIISIIVLSMGFLLLNRMTSGGAEQVSEMDAKLESQIERLLTDSSLPVAIPIRQKEIARGDMDQFGVGVVNYEDEGSTEFSVGVHADECFDEEGNSCNKDDVKVMSSFDLANDDESKDIEFQKNAKFVVPIKVDDNADSGMYVFNVCVCQGDPTSCSNDCDGTTESYYSEQIYKLYVKVP